MTDTIHKDKLHVQDESPLVEREEPQPSSEAFGPVPVAVVGPVATTTAATQFGTYETIVLPASSASIPTVQRVLPYDPLRQYAYITAVDAPIVLSTTLEQAQSPNNIATSSVTTANPTPSQPAVPATGVAQQNTNLYPVTVVITAGGATITNVSVNGITVGTAAGTYTVPAFGAISIAYSVATPTWVWSDANAALVTSFTAPNASGSFLAAGQTTPTIRHNEPVYAANTSTANPSRVTIYVERGGVTSGQFDVAYPA